MNLHRDYDSNIHESMERNRGEQNSQSITHRLREFREASHRTDEENNQQPSDRHQNFYQPGMPSDFSCPPNRLPNRQGMLLLPPSYPGPPTFNAAKTSHQFVQFSQPPPGVPRPVPTNTPFFPFGTALNNVPHQNNNTSMQNTYHRGPPPFSPPNNPPPVGSLPNATISTPFQQQQPPFGTPMQNFSSGSLPFHLSRPPPPIVSCYPQQFVKGSSNVESDRGMIHTKNETSRQEHVQFGAQEEVNQWLKQKGKSNISLSPERIPKSKDINDKRSGTVKSIIKEEVSELSKEGKTSQELTINVAQNELCTILHSLAAVQGGIQNVEEAVEADEKTWTERLEKLLQLKESYLKAKQEIDLNSLRKIKRKIDLRKKKRERQKCRKKEDKEIEQQLLFERTLKHAAIDAWRNKLRQEYVDQQETKKMKEQADKTLSKVRREIKETRKMMDTIVRLTKLREIRTDTAAKRGQMFPQSVADHFKDKTNDLIKLLAQQMESYEKEEDALKLILETEKEEAKDKERKAFQQKKAADEQKELEKLRECLFGPPVSYGAEDPMQPFIKYYQQSQYSLLSLQHIRQQWDSFLVPEGTPMASRIPDGWVMPVAPSSKAWASALQSKSS